MDVHPPNKEKYDMLSCEAQLCFRRFFGFLFFLISSFFCSRFFRFVVSSIYGFFHFLLFPGSFPFYLFLVFFCIRLFFGFFGLLFYSVFGSFLFSCEAQLPTVLPQKNEAYLCFRVKHTPRRSTILFT